MAFSTFLGTPGERSAGSGDRTGFPKAPGVPTVAGGVLRSGKESFAQQSLGDLLARNVIRTILYHLLEGLNSIHSDLWSFLK
jgi:hypothetical protein